MHLGVEVLRYQTKRVRDIKRSSIDCNMTYTLYLDFVSQRYKHVVFIVCQCICIKAESMFKLRFSHSLLGISLHIEEETFKSK